MQPPDLFFVLKMILAILGLLRFRMNFMIASIGNNIMLVYLGLLDIYLQIHPGFCIFLYEYVVINNLNVILHRINFSQMKYTVDIHQLKSTKNALVVK